MDYSLFRKNLRCLLESRGYTCKGLAEGIGSAPATISRYLTGVRNPNGRVLLKIGQFFNVSVDWLVGFSDDKYDFMKADVQEFSRLYSLASDYDKLVCNTVLEKYKVLSGYENKMGGNE